MRRSTRFFVGLAAAVLTYAGLMAAVGPRHFQYRSGYPDRAYGYGRHYPCDDVHRNTPHPNPTPEAGTSNQQPLNNN